MPAPPLIGDVFEITTFGTLGGIPCDHVMHWHIINTSRSPEQICGDIAAANNQAMSDHILPFLQPEYTLTSSRAIYLGDTTVPPALVTTSANGSSAAPFGSRQLCWTIRHAVRVRGRGRQGRTNFPGPATTDIDQATGHIKGTSQAALLSAYAAYRQAIISAAEGISGTAELIVVSRKTGTWQRIMVDEIDLAPNTHRRWQKRLARHR